MQVSLHMKGADLDVRIYLAGMKSYRVASGRQHKTYFFLLFNVNDVQKLKTLVSLANKFVQVSLHHKHSSCELRFMRTSL